MKSTEELLREVLALLHEATSRHDPIKHKNIFSALSVAHEQTRYALHLRELSKKDPVQNIHDQLREMPLIDNRSKAAGEKEEE